MEVGKEGPAVIRTSGEMFFPPVFHGEMEWSVMFFLNEERVTENGMVLWMTMLKVVVLDGCLIDRC